MDFFNLNFYNMECKFCKVEMGKYFVFGLIERKIFHKGFGDISPREFRALALLRVPCCDTCVANMKSNSSSKNLMYALGCTAGAFFSFLIGLGLRGSNESVMMFLGIVMILLVVGAISYFVKWSKLTLLGENPIAEECLARYIKNGAIEKEDIVASSTSERISIHPQQGAEHILNSVTVDYHCISSKRIEKFQKPTKRSSTSLSKQGAMTILKDWYIAST